MSLVRVLPAWFHAIADYAVGVLLIVGPAILGITGGIAAFYVVMGVAVLAVSLITNYQYSDKREWNRTSPLAA